MYSSSSNIQVPNSGLIKTYHDKNLCSSSICSIPLIQSIIKNPNDEVYDYVAEKCIFKLKYIGLNKYVMEEHPDFVEIFIEDGYFKHYDKIVCFFNNMMCIVSRGTIQLCPDCTCSYKNKIITNWSVYESLKTKPPIYACNFKFMYDNSDANEKQHMIEYFKLARVDFERNDHKLKLQINNVYVTECKLVKPNVKQVTGKKSRSRSKSPKRNKQKMIVSDVEIAEPIEIVEQDIDLTNQS